MRNQKIGISRALVTQASMQSCAASMQSLFHALFSPHLGCVECPEACLLRCTRPSISLPCPCRDLGGRNRWRCQPPSARSLPKFLLARRAPSHTPVCLLLNCPVGACRDRVRSPGLPSMHSSNMPQLEHRYIYMRAQLSVFHANTINRYDKIDRAHPS